MILVCKKTHPTVFHPSMNASFDISAKAGACTISRGTKISALSRFRPKSWRYLIVPLTPVLSSSSVDSAKSYFNQSRQFYGNGLGVLTSVLLEELGEAVLLFRKWCRSVRCKVTVGFWVSILSTLKRKVGY